MNITEKLVKIEDLGVDDGRVCILHVIEKG